ncbi:hypothetical protein PG990_002513 [Apiospora arundinis]
MALPGPHGYEPLSNPNDIRLLDIHPGTTIEDIPSISLRIVNLSDAPDFEALSYVWGDIQNTIEILCNGHPVRVTANLHDALKQLRNADGRPRTLWVDALCINQMDLDEKSAQIRIMHRIYQACRRCVVWLGRADEHTDSALDMVQLMAELVCEKVGVPLEGLDDHLKAAGRDILQATEIGYSERLPPMDSPKWVSLFSLLCRQWFTRVWVIQEAFFSSDLLFYCGARTCRYSALYYTADWIITNGRPIDYATGFQWAEVERFNIMYMRQDAYVQQNQKLSQLLADFSLFRATDSRDKIYALMHLPAFQRDCPNLVPDYRLPIEVVYVDMAFRILRNSRDLLLLTKVDRRDGDEGALRLPSWVPRWHNPEVKRYPSVSSVWYEFMGAGGKSDKAKGAQSLRLLAPVSASDYAHAQIATAEGREEADDDGDDNDNEATISKCVLGIVGIEFDVIHDVCELQFWGRRVPDEPRIPLFRTRTGPWERYYPRKAGDETSSSEPTSSVKDYPYATEPEIIYAYAMTLTSSCREYKGHYSIRCAESNYKHHAADFVAFLTWVRTLRRDESRDEDGGGTSTTSRLNGQPIPLGDFYPPGLYAAERPTLIDADGDEVTTMSRRYSIMAAQYNMNRCLYRTRRGYLGNGLHDVQRGDVVCVFMGGAVPFILRLRADGEGYTLIGDAYVHGIMDGELVKDWEAGKTDLDLREFRIH